MEKLIDLIYTGNENSTLSDDDIVQIAQRFKILSESSRLRILRSLFDGEKSVTEIIAKTGMLQANASKQLKILQKNNIVSCRPEGLMRYYRLTDHTVLKICHAICGSLNN
jgi:DNA-binding transcriptional ArsR family regulator